MGTHEPPMFTITDRRVGGAMSTSTLVETVSINYEDFHDSFLTCGTCLCNYDGSDHPPKLLPCSHTVCRPCLEHIVTASRERNSIRCPICRGTVAVPAGGVSSFPPSFLVNQLLDLMARQRRDIIPKCTLHPAQELMFCETCDQVFCQDCTGGSHNGRGASAHTVIPFSIAIKRMSEILLYKATQCIKNLDRAAQVVADEISHVQATSEACMQDVSCTFTELLALVEERRRELVKAVTRVCEDKKRVLREQLDIIETEKARVQAECTGLQQQVEVRNITKKIADLNERLDMSSNLVEPRENSFVKLEFTHNTSIMDLKSSLDTLGRIRISKTFPALCSVQLDSPRLHLETVALVTTVDYHGNPRNSGSDPLCARVVHEDGSEVECRVQDHNNGTYSIHFTAHAPGEYTLSAEIFGRPLGDSPLTFSITPHHPPLERTGRRGLGELEFVQPLSVVKATDSGRVYVLDTGNSRLQVLNSDLSFSHEISRHGLEEHSATGLALTPRGTLIVCNWRTKYVCELNAETGEVLLKFTSSHFREPIAVTVTRYNEIVVADNGLGQLLVFDAHGQYVRTLAARGDGQGQLKNVTCVHAHGDTLLVTDHRLQVFNHKGAFLRELQGAPGKGKYGGVCVDENGQILATHQDRHGGSVLLMHTDGTLNFSLDSHGDKLRRPGGLAALGDGHVLVCDLGSDALKKYRYV